MKKGTILIIFVLLFIQAFADINKLFDDLKNAKTDTAKVSKLLDISIAYRSKDLDKSSEYALQAYNLAVKSNDTTHIINTSLNLGFHYSLSNHRKEALEVLYFGLEYATKRNNDDLRVKFYTNIGNCYGMFSDFESALQYYKSALKISKNNNDPLQISRLENNIGEAYFELDSLDKALNKYNIALKINRKEGFEEGLLYNHSNIGNVYLEKEKFSKASKHFYIHLALAKKYKNPIHVLWAHEYLSKLYLELKDYDIALTHSDSVIAMSNKLNYRDALSNTYIIRAKAEYNLKKFQQAYLDILSRNKIADSVHRIEQFNIAEDVKLQQDYKEQVKMLNLEKENATLLKKKNQFNLIVLALIIVALLLSFIIVYLNNKNKIKASLLEQEILREKNETIKFKNESIELELDKKNKELTSNVLQLSNLNTFITSVSKELEDKKKNFKDSNIKIINKIIRNIHSNTDNKIWKEFENRFENVHSGFYENLYKDHPKLTPNEKKLCAFLKLNMSSKDISGITGQSVHSIEVARTRLRKKLGLSNREESLIEFIDKY